MATKLYFYEKNVSDKKFQQFYFLNKFNVTNSDVLVIIDHLDKNYFFSEFVR